MPDDQQAKILIVDDLPSNIQVVANILDSAGYHIVFTQNGSSVPARAGDFDLILLDIMMPETDGFAICEKLKRNPGTKNIPVIFLTAKTGVENVVRGFEAGAVDYLTKPFNGTELLARVRTHLELKSSRETLEISNRKLREANKALTEFQKKLEKAARTDPLTKLSNRLDIMERLEEERNKFEETGKPFSVILADIDDFKQFNDKYGHDCGDYVLISVAMFIRSKIGKTNTASRWGGEEFLLLLPETGPEKAREIAETIRRGLFENDYACGRNKFKVSMTLGISVFSRSMSLDQCIKKADVALYEGKKRGKNCVALSE